MNQPIYPLVDHPARQSALDTSSSWILEAPAGSGKTSLLVARIIRLLAYHAQQPEEVLALTFTRKAASEMRHRVLEQCLANTSPDARALNARGWALTTAPQRLQILTIDAYAAKLASGNPNQKDMVLPAPDLLYEHACRTILQRADEIPRPDWAPDLDQLLQRFGNHSKKVIRLFSKMLAVRDQWLGLMTDISRHESAEELIDQHLAHYIEIQLRNLDTHLSADLKAVLLPTIRLASDCLRENDPDAPLCLWSTLETWPEPKPSSVKHLQALANWLLTTHGAWRRVVNVRQGVKPGTLAKAQMQAVLNCLDTPEYERLRKHLKRIRTCPTPDDFDGCAIKGLCRLLPIFAASLQLSIDEFAQKDHTAITLEALAALGDADAPTELALRLDHQIKHLLIDECQDTSFSQYRLFEKLTAGWQQDDGRTLFMVGDPMQSIYRFRQADASLFLRIGEHGLGNVYPKRLRLETNFRSSPELCQWFNTQLSKRFPKYDQLDIGAVAYRPCEALDVPGQRQAVMSTQLPLNDPICLPDALSDLLKDMNRVGGRSAILVRTRRHAKPLLEALNQLEVAYEASALQDLAQQPIIQDLLSLTQLLYQPEAPLPILALLRSSLFGLSLAQLKACVNAAAAQELSILAFLMKAQTLPLPDTLIQAILPRLSALKTLYKRRTEMNACAWVQAAWESLGGPEAYPRPTDWLAHDQFMECAQNALTQIGDIHIDQLKANLESTPIIQTSVPPEHQVLQIMTIHQAKGLEFDAVCVIGMLDQRVPIDLPLLLWTSVIDEADRECLLFAAKPAPRTIDPLYHHLIYIEADKTAAERARLDYVACTRAKQALWIDNQQELCTSS